MWIMQQSTDKREFKSDLSLNGFKLLVNEPTLLTSTIIDIIATNKENIKETKVIPSSFNDHGMVVCLRKLNLRSSHLKQYVAEITLKYNLETLKQQLQDLDWSPVYETTNLNESITTFNETNFNKKAVIIEKKLRDDHALGLMKH